jgi:hypothetical protein
MAGDTFTSSLRIQLQGTGNNPETWGQITDVQFQKIEAAITGDNGFSTGGIDLTGLASPYSLTTNNGTLDQASNLLYPFSGTLTSDMTVLIPGSVKIGWIVNATSGGHNVILKVGSGTTLTVAPGGNWTFFYCDGANVIAPTITFGSGIGPITVNGNAVIHGTVSVDSSVTAGDDAAGGQFRATFGSYGVMLRNDGATASLLQTAPGAPLGTFNSFRPFAWNLATGAVTIDGAASGTTIGGNLVLGGLLANINGLAAFDIGNFGGFPTVSFAANEFLQWNGSVLSISTTGNVAFTCGAMLVNGVGVILQGSSPTFTDIQANGFVNIVGVQAESGAGMVMSNLGISSGSIPWNIAVSLTCTGAVVANIVATQSDRRVKHDIRDIDPSEGVAWVQRARPRRYLKDGRPEAGFIAQEDYESGFKDSISPMRDDRPEFAESDGVAASGFRLVRDYNQDSAYLTAALKVALRQIDELLERVAALEDEAV